MWVVHLLTDLPKKPAEWLNANFNIHYVAYGADDTELYAPVNTTNFNYWWNVLTFGSQTRCTQIAFQAYAEKITDVENAIFICSQQDNSVTDWKQVC